MSLILSLSILVLLPRTAYSFQGKSSESNIKSATFVSEMFEVEPGLIAGKTFWDIEFPKGHIGVKSFDAELIDEDGNPVPLFETYLHHWFAIRYLENVTIASIRGSKVPPKNYDGFIWKRNQGMCHEYILPHYWGLGVESRGTISNIPDPFAVELRNPAEIPDGYEEKWLFNILAIDTRGTQDRKGCSECRCDLMNLTKNFYNVTKGIIGEPLTPDYYKGGLLCCQDNLKCKLREGFEGPKRKLALRYKIRWVDWDENQIPLNFYILDSTDKMKSNGSTSFHECQVEFTIPANGSNDSPHIQKTKIPMEKGGYLIYGTAHLHSGAINATLYGEDGRTLCTSTAKYGTGNEAGNEKGYAVGMSVCYPKPGSIKIKDGEILTVEARYENGFLTGAMGHMYIYLAEQLPHDTLTS
ncbi:uncharacterized protein LOC133306947 [Gastrolobium bilobum]|uniref:uncharacterized protein LOC133306947 n=1 Tax=Gastrolobium bilobum TaxID=150636 RepID=UPI002AB1E8A5|nr:uncharacterized protein LOC133306947 [Gastrolobium bilobum]